MPVEPSERSRQSKPARAQRERRMATGVATEPTRLCFFISTSGGSRSLPLYFASLGDALADRGHRVVLLVDGEEQPRVRTRDRLSVYRWPSKRPTKARDAAFLSSLVGVYRPSCLVAQFGATNVNMLVGRFRNVPCRVECYHTLQAQRAMDSEVGRSLLSFLRLVRKRLIYSLATDFMAISAAAANDLAASYRVQPASCNVLHPLIRDPSRLPGAAGAFGSRSNLLVCAGRLCRSKAQDVLLKAIPAVKEVIPEVIVEFLGDGPEKPSYVRLANDLGLAAECRFLGSVAPDVVLRRMAAACVTVVPSRREAFGMVNIESLSVGTPIIASDVDGIREIVRDGKDGFLVPVGDPQALATRIIEVLRDRTLREKLGRNARRRFSESFSVEANMGRHVEWYERVALSRIGPDWRVRRRR